MTQDELAAIFLEAGIKARGLPRSQSDANEWLSMSLWLAQELIRRRPRRDPLPERDKDLHGPD